jgi:hypothetical protein
MHAAAATNTREGKAIRNVQLAHGLYRLNNPHDMLANLKTSQGLEARFIIQTLSERLIEQNAPDSTKEQTSSFSELEILRDIMREILSSPNSDQRAILILAYKMQMVRLQYYLVEKFGFNERDYMALKNTRTYFAHSEGEAALSIFTPSSNAANLALHSFANENLPDDISLQVHTHQLLKSSGLSLFPDSALSPTP